MSPDTLLILVFVVFLVLLACETPVAWALAASGALGLSLLRHPDLVTSLLGTSPYRATSSYTLSIIPMYVLLGMFALHGRLAERLYKVASSALRNLPGGLGVATVGACAGFAAVTGSSVATAATIGKVSIGEMRKFGYPPGFAAGIVATAGTLGILIPPSIVIVIYGVIAQESIARLLVAGIIPGIVSALVYAVFIVVMARKLVPVLPRPALARVLDTAIADAAARRGAAPAPQPERPSEPASVLDTIEMDDPDKVSSGQALRAVVWIGVIFCVVLAGIYSGYFTVIESGAIAAMVGLLMLFVENGSQGLRAVLRKFYYSLLEAASVTSMTFSILVGATILSTFLVMTRFPMRFTDWILAFDVPPLMIVVALLASLILLGMFLETLSILIICVPLMHPVVVSLGFDGIWFAILVVKMIEIGMVTPPVGINVFVVAGASGVTIEQAFRGVLPFVLADLVVVGILIAFPWLVTWLPSIVVT